MLTNDDPARSIRLRPSAADDRTEVGHFEADLIVSVPGDPTALISLVDRKTNKCLLRKILQHDAQTYRTTLEEMLVGTPGPKLSVTLDNGGEDAQHKTLEATLGVVSYFCDPYCSFQKPVVERQNKEVRKYVPKGTRLSTLTDRDVQRIEDRLNDRWMKRLGYEPPADAFIREITPFLS